MAKAPITNDQYSNAETVRRREATLKVMLNTPPKPQKEMVGRRNAKKAKRKTKSR